ncbi:MAG: methionyl-tRNA formyltransferase [Victivallaceae bacterium]|nr:methionyl-tRNA formyltransferase [Victivallaceae bacterium]
MIDKIRLYFLGSGNIAVPVLEVLATAETVELLGAGTQVDQPAGRKRQLTPTPVGQFAAAAGIDADKLASVRDAQFMNKMRSLKPDFIVVASFGQILRPELLEIPVCCGLNVHASILPKYRGAAPISAAILNGDAETGVTFMKMDQGLDTGDIYGVVKIPLCGDEYADALEERLGILAAEHIVEILQQIKCGRLAPRPQDEAQAVLTRKVKKDDGRMVWTLPAAKLAALVRAYHPWPGAYFSLPGQPEPLLVRITAARPAACRSGKPGEILQADKKALMVACGSGALEILKLIPQGKKEMSGTAFLNGHPLRVGIEVENG